jgi:hypothetical protein
VISAQEVQELDKALAAADQGGMSVDINGERFTARRMYDVVARGAVFGADSQSRAVFGKLSNVPWFSQLFWFHFYFYAETCFLIMRRVFEIVKRAEDALPPRDKKWAPGGPQCLFCLRTEVKYSEEHIIPEAFGTDELVLPKGYVCDRCNSGTLAGLDRALLAFPPIAMMRVMHVPHRKAGKFPSAEIGQLRMRRTVPTHVVIQDPTGAVRSDPTPIGDGWVKWDFTIPGIRVDMIRVARALYKIGLSSSRTTEAMSLRWTRAMTRRVSSF